MWDWEGLLVAFPVVTYGFTAHHFMFGIYSTLRQHTVKRMSTVLRKVRHALPAHLLHRTAPPLLALCSAM